jgi:hypothetical protein
MHAIRTFRKRILGNMRHAKPPTILVIAGNIGDQIRLIRLGVDIGKKLCPIHFGLHRQRITQAV